MLVETVSANGLDPVMPERSGTAVTTGLPATVPPSPPLPDIESAHARLLSNPSLQFDRTGFVPPEIPAWLHWIGDVLRAIAPALQYVFWGGVILLVGLLLFAIGREVIKLRGPRAKGALQATPIEPEWHPDVGTARDLLAQADALASKGLYADAVHLLLLRSVEDIQKRKPKALRVSLTTREISALDAIPAGARPAFERIGRLVERSLFGAAPVQAHDFADCRNAYEAFALPGEWRAKDPAP